MCNFVIASSVAPGYGCCRCHVYNGLQRVQCKSCGESHCVPLAVPDNTLGIYFEDGGSTKVKVLAVNADDKGYGFDLEAIESLRSSPIVKDIEPGETWSPWASHKSSAYSGGGLLWQLQGVE